MGKALQIRVMAVTWNEDLLEELWPRLSELAFSVPRHEKRGVLEMVDALEDGLRFLPWSKERREAMGPRIGAAVLLKANLEAALAEWNTVEANALSNALEDVLDRLERDFVE